MSGKTTFIKTLLVRLHQREQIPNESIYIIDFSGNMGEYSKLPNVCACFDNSNEENVKRVFKAVEAQLAKNVRLLKGQSFVGCEFKNQKTDIRHIIFIIENFNSFLADERYDSYQEAVSYTHLQCLWIRKTEITILILEMPISFVESTHWH